MVKGILYTLVLSCLEHKTCSMLFLLISKRSHHYIKITLFFCFIPFILYIIIKQSQGLFFLFFPKKSHLAVPVNQNNCQQNTHVVFILIVHLFESFQSLHSAKKMHEITQHVVCLHIDCHR